MNPLDLHHTLDGDVPLPRPVCCGCRATEDDVVLVPLRGAPSIFLCGGCSTMATMDAIAEGGRHVCMSLLEVDLTAPLRPGS